MKYAIIPMAISEKMIMATSPFGVAYYSYTYVSGVFVGAKFAI